MVASSGRDAVGALKGILSENLKRIEERIFAVCARVGRDQKSVKLIAVTKYAEMDWISCLYDLGVSVFGESRPQQLVSRAKLLPSDVEWHQIGHLQRNKVASLLPVVNCIHSVDSLRLVDQIDAESELLGTQARILLEVNVSGESTKDGFELGDLESAWQLILRRKSLVVDGLMTMAPATRDSHLIRSVFRSLREIRDRMRENAGGTCVLPELSMGMSSDFEEAIEEGATMVRVGSDLFKGLSKN